MKMQKFTLRLNADLYDQLRGKAAAQQVTIAELARAAIEKALPSLELGSRHFQVWDNSTVQVPLELLLEIRADLDTGHVIRAIKTTRAGTGLGLKEARSIVDTLRDERGGP